MSALKLAIEFYKEGCGPTEAAGRANTATPATYKKYGVEVTPGYMYVTPGCVSSRAGQLKISRKSRDNKPTELKIMPAYMIMKCSDMMEGRGPMMFDKMFLYREDAVKYIDSRGDGWGRFPKFSEHPGVWEMKKVEIYTAAVDTYEADRAALKERAISKLTDEEREVLGLFKK